MAEVGLGDGVVTLALPVVPEVLRGPFLDRFLFVVVHLVRLAIQCPSGFLLCYRGLSLSFPPLQRHQIKTLDEYAMGKVNEKRGDKRSMELGGSECEKVVSQQASAIIRTSESQD